MGQLIMERSVSGDGIMFKKCGISNAINGSEDYIIWEDDDYEQFLHLLQWMMERELAAEAVYNDRFSNEQYVVQFGDSDEEDEFDRFLAFLF